MIVTIDGPAGAGKSSAARGLARRLGFSFLDTGALYRAVTLAAMREGIDLADRSALAELASRLQLALTNDRVVMNGADVTDAIRTFQITSLTRHAADNQAVREQLTELQRRFAAGRDVITEGRDQATVVFPDAEVKIFLTAGETCRAERRYQDLLKRGEEVDFQGVLEKQRRRDQQDFERAVGGLAKAADSIEVDTDDLTPEQVIDRLEQVVRQKMADGSVC